MTDSCDDGDGDEVNYESDMASDSNGEDLHFHLSRQHRLTGKYSTCYVNSLIHFNYNRDSLDVEVEYSTKIIVEGSYVTSSEVSLPNYES